jgi:streptogramin lyase
MLRTLGPRIASSILWLLALGLPSAARALETGSFRGEVRDQQGAALAGAMVTFTRGTPAHSLTVYSDAQGRFRTPPLPAGAGYALRVRHLGHRDLRLEAPPLAGEPELSLALARESDPAALAAQLPANHWYQLLLERVGDAAQREELKRQCTFCHQQGSLQTRTLREPEEWRKVLHLMGRMGALLSADLRAQLPELLNQAYDPAAAVPALAARFAEPGFSAAPAPAARGALVEEWDLGGRASMQHDVVLHPDGRLYSVDMSQDQLYRLDPREPGGLREAWGLPQEGLPLGGVFAAAGGRVPANSNARVGPHSIQAAPDGSLWITLALGNRLARFDPASERFSLVELEHGYYPHTLRIDGRGRIWYTIAASNHLGFYDPQSGVHRELRLPAGSFSQDLVLRAMPFALWLGRFVDLRSRAAEGDGFQMPVPYGVDIAPDGGVWFSQLNEHRIGRVDPESFAVEMIDTPFAAPRRLRFDGHGRLWIPSFSESLVARFDPATREFARFELPIEPRGSETPYALNVDRERDRVWICGTNSDTLIRFEPASERFTVYPLPTRVTYTREIVFDERGRVWTSNSNVPTWQIEGGLPKVLRLDPDPEAGAPPAAQRGAAAEPSPSSRARARS